MSFWACASRERLILTRTSPIQRQSVISAKRSLPPNATWTNSIGASALTAFWKDPDFDPDERAFYYVRVIEIPKPRWTAYDAKFYGVEMPDEVPMTTQDRAYTSPIWYTP